MDLAPGTMVRDSLRLVQLLGEGGMGSVWIARHLTLETEVAVKFVSAEALRLGGSQVLERFGREAKAAARIQSPHVVEIKDFGTMPSGIPFYVMELLDGESLAECLARTSTLPLEQALAISRQVAKALAAAHRRGVVHRDIKPDNIFLCAPEEDGDIFIKVLDFGVAKLSDLSGSKLTGAQSLLGTPEYMSPEQLAAPTTVDLRTDLWALGVVTFQMLTGRLPFAGRTTAELVSAIRGGSFALPSSLNPDLPGELDTWFSRALHVAREQRFASARELAGALERACGFVRAEQSSIPDLPAYMRPAPPQPVAGAEDDEALLDPTAPLKPVRIESLGPARTRDATPVSWEEDTVPMSSDPFEGQRDAIIRAMAPLHHSAPFAGADQPTPPPKLTLSSLSALVTIAGSDGSITLEEWSAILSAARHAGLSSGEIKLLKVTRTAPVALEELDLGALPAEERPILYAVAVWLARVGGAVNVTETDLLDRLGALLQLPEEVRHSARAAADEAFRQLGPWRGSGDFGRLMQVLHEGLSAPPP